MMMKWHIFATIILIQLKTFHCNTIEISSYSQVAKNGRTNEEPTKNTNQPLQVHRAREGVINSDLWLLKTFNKTATENDNNANTDQATGRAIDNARPFPFPLKNSVFSSYDKPSNHRPNQDPRIIYASSPVQQIAQDRFVPHESTDHFIDKNNRNRNRNQNHNRVKTQAIFNESDREDDGPPQVDAPPSDAKPASIDYQPPKHLYSFPPNSGSLYPPPGDTRKPISVSSYLPPASGPTNYPIYPGPVMPRPVSSLHTQVDNSGSTNNDMGSDDSGDSNMDGNANMDSGDSDQPSDDMKLVDRPPSNFMPNNKPEFPALSFSNGAPLDHPPDHEHDHNHDHSPDYDNHHHDDHIHEHGSFSPYDESLKHLHGIPAFPEVIVDDLHHDHDYFEHHHHHPHFDHPPPPPPTTTPLPPPPPPPPEPEEPEEQPRVKKYSYFYLSRSLWYIPLYFTVWFTFYVTYLILLSIGRHKVDLPNHVTSRRSIRDLTNLDLTHNETVDKVNTLTTFVMSQIEDFEKKYF